ncbi:MAG TPA: M3 family metallopeptidase [Coxiellaceae bacterium]|nr:MAG: oligopeptidase A [Gammaproteobacteria bacterium RIFCSPHIGHO2_12_FULL_36_30]HLB55955.1 M3 family metallopeptidase [Coxiellaceae bacterium]
MSVATLPTFSNIQVCDIEKNVNALLKKNLSKIDALLNQTHFTWGNLWHPIETLNDELQQLWGPIQHLNAVVNAPDLRDAVNACLPKLSDYQTHISHNEKLFHAIESIKNSEQFKKFNIAQQTAINHELRDFKLNGVHLSSEKKEQFAKLSKSLSQLSHQFEENVLDATMAFKKYITDEKLLSGIPEHAKKSAQNLAKKENKEGWLFTLDAPDYLAIMLNADSSELRQEMYYAHVTRASEIEPNAKKFDNSDAIQAILKNRFELAHLLDFKNYAELSLATKMVKNTNDVLAFLNELAEKTLPAAHKEFQALSHFAKKELGMEKLNAWDIAYASEKLRLKEYAISPEDLRPYFPEPQVLNGLFKIIYRLYGITLKKVDADVWHRDATCYQLIDQNKNPVAHIFFDLYARPNKRGGAWMDECRIRRYLDDGKIQLPAAYVTCNFNAPIDGQPALFMHDDVITLFHECGHALQHVLTKMDVAAVSGIQGIPWDAVEIASQFFENWAWEKNAMPYIAEHYQTHQLLPDDLYQRMDRAKNFQSAMQMARQLEFALFDFHLHMEFDENNPQCVQTILNTVRKKIAVFSPPNFNRFQNSFSHIFGGSYAAGYYSYKWAEVMACDAFSLFEEKGIFDHMLSEKFKSTFLESGGAKDPMDLFVAFRGRKPTVDALLKQSGIM